MRNKYYKPKSGSDKVVITYKNGKTGKSVTRTLSGEILAAIYCAQGKYPTFANPILGAVFLAGIAIGESGARDPSFFEYSKIKDPKGRSSTALGTFQIVKGTRNRLQKIVKVPFVSDIGVQSLYAQALVRQLVQSIKNNWGILKKPHTNRIGNAFASIRHHYTVGTPSSPYFNDPKAQHGLNAHLKLWPYAYAELYKWYQEALRNGEIMCPLSSLTGSLSHRSGSVGSACDLSGDAPDLLEHDGWREYPVPGAPNLYSLVPSFLEEIKTVPPAVLKDAITIAKSSDVPWVITSVRTDYLGQQRVSPNHGGQGAIDIAPADESGALRARTTSGVPRTLRLWANIPLLLYLNDLSATLHARVGVETDHLHLDDARPLGVYVYTTARPSYANDAALQKLSPDLIPVKEVLAAYRM